MAEQDEKTFSARRAERTLLGLRVAGSVLTQARTVVGDKSARTGWLSSEALKLRSDHSYCSIVRGERLRAAQATRKSSAASVKGRREGWSRCGGM
jgi:hypothetical protein